MQVMQLAHLPANRPHEAIQDGSVSRADNGPVKWRLRLVTTVMKVRGWFNKILGIAKVK